MYQWAINDYYETTGGGGTTEAQTYAEENNLFFVETSAKTAINVNDIFYEIARRLPRAQPAQNPTGMVLTDRPLDRPQTSACCS